MQFLIIISSLVLAGHCVESDVLEKAEIPSGKDCLPGTTWISHCNGCMCSHDGYGLCTRIGCPESEYGPEKTCAPNTVWKNDCNTCRCLSNGEGAVCTLMRCTRNIEVEERKGVNSKVYA